jgi:3'-5' exoribonuclease
MALMIFQILAKCYIPKVDFTSVINLKSMVTGIRSGDKVESYFAVKYKKSLREYKYGWMFEVRLADSTGEITAKYWGEPDREAVQAIFDSFESGSVVWVSGEAREFGQSVELGVNPKGGGAMRRLERGGYDLDALVGKSPADSDNQVGELVAVVASVKNPHLSALLGGFFGSGSGTLQIFSEAPASMQMHSNYRGGLLEHSLKVAAICDSMARQYPSVDRELLLAGALLHDIGKVRELEIGTSIEVSNEGMFLGHIAIGERMVGEAIASIEGFPKEMELKLLHMILSHHGRKEWGSPKEPQTPEALLLHLADMADSQVFQYLRARAEARTDDSWAWDRRLGHIYLK